MLLLLLTADNLQMKASGKEVEQGRNNMAAVHSDLCQGGIGDEKQRRGIHTTRLFL
jgi:hypothetical protein